MFSDPESHKRLATLKIFDLYGFVEHGTCSGDIPAANAEDVEIAVEAAKKAFSRNKGKDWSSASGAYRAKYLRAIAAKVQFNLQFC